MPCTNCGEDGDEGYTVRFTNAGREPTKMELSLCETCAEEFREESGVVVQ